MATSTSRYRGHSPPPEYEEEEQDSPPSREPTPVEAEPEPVPVPTDKDTGYVEPTAATVLTREPRHLSFGSNFPTIIYQLRSLQLIALLVQICILYMESDRMGLALALPLAIHILNFYHTGKRLYMNIDGRFDLRQIFGVRNLLLKARYAYAVFGSLFYAILAHFVTGEIPSTVSAVLYTVSKFTSFGGSAAVVAAEIFETVMNRFGQSSTIPSKSL